MRLKYAAAAATALVLAGCAARRPPLDPALAGRADALVRQGCYDCLLDARELYQQLLADGRTPDAAVRLFEVHLLIALRAKELVVDPGDALSRARALAPGLPAATEAARYLELIDIVPPDERGASKTAREPLLEAMRRPQFRAAALGWMGQSSLAPRVKEYVALSVECARPTLRDRSVPPPADTAPLLAFRRAICRPVPDAAALEALRLEVPRFVEAGVFAARATVFGGKAGLAGGTWAERSAARGWLGAARQRFPASPVIPFELGVLAQIEGDLRQAAGHYADTLAIEPRHEDARLGRAIAFTYLNQPEPAVADATTLIDARAYNRGEAFYWRAFNRHRAATEHRQGVPAAGDVTAARADIEQAKLLASSSRVLTLAGMIEYDQGQLDEATADLTAAVKMDAANCAARWYLGVVKHAQEAWVPSGAAFGEAARCYDLSAARSERARDEMAVRTDVDEEFRARQLAGFEAAIREDRSQESAAALNAGIGYARGGDTAAAERFLDQAAKDPARRLTVADVRQVMKGPQ